MTFDLEEYKQFIDLQNVYRTSKESLTQKVLPVIEKLWESERFPGQKHQGNLSSNPNFEEDTISYSHWCCGDTDYDSIRLQDLADPKWHEALDEKWRLTNQKIQDYNQKQKLEETGRSRETPQGS